MEMLCLEIFSTYFMLERHKDDVGLITQWGVGAWLILQELNESSPQHESELARHQHISKNYTHRLTAELISNNLLKKTTDDKDPIIEITQEGRHALNKLTDVLHKNIPNWADEFTPEEISSTVRTLVKLRHILSLS
jgi:DNA-binding MarR family transcriptional regulator